MAIFWRALDWRTYKFNKKMNEEEEQDRYELVDRPDWQKECAELGDAYIKAALTARRAAAMSIIYKARDGRVKDTGRKGGPAPPHPPALGDKSILDHLHWIPARFRLQFAQILHFALAVLITRLSLGEVPSAIKVNRLKYWMIKDLRSFCGAGLAAHLERWQNEVEQRFLKGEVGLFETFEFPGFTYELSPQPVLKYEPFAQKQKGLFFHVWKTFASADEYDISISDPEAAQF